MPTSKITEAQREEAIRRGQEVRRSQPHATSVAYDAKTRTYTLAMLAGGQLSFRADQVRELAGASPEQLARVELSPSGGGISWPELDVDIDMTGLVMDLVAGETWRTAFRSLLAKEISSVKSEAKADAARQNGKLGGRPRKDAQPRSGTATHRGAMIIGEPGTPTAAETTPPFSS